jgi:hypothetical protein
MRTTERPRVELASRAHPRARPAPLHIAPAPRKAALPSYRFSHDVIHMPRPPCPPRSHRSTWRRFPPCHPPVRRAAPTRLPLATSRSHAPTFPRVTHRASRRLPPCHPPVRRAAPTRLLLATSLPRRVSPAPPRAATLRRRTPAVRLTATTRPPPPLASRFRASHYVTRRTSHRHHAATPAARVLRGVGAPPLTPRDVTPPRCASGGVNGSLGCG